MEDLDAPICQKGYGLYKTFYNYRNTIKKQDRFGIWLRSENLILEILEKLLLASQLIKTEKLPVLNQVSAKLNLLRVTLRLAKEVQVIDLKKYITLQTIIDEIGRMLGGWIKSLKV